MAQKTQIKVSLTQSTMPVVAVYTEPDKAHLAVSKLEGSGVEAWLLDEATTQLNWLYTDAIGGIRVEVNDEDFERALEILDLPQEESGIIQCPHCGSEDIQVRKISLLSALSIIFLNLILPTKKIDVDCRACHRSFKIDS